MSDHQVSGERFVASLTVPGRIESIRPASCFLVEAARNLKLAVAANPLFEVAIAEALTNTIEHTPRDGRSSIRCEIEITSNRLTVRILDEAARAPVALALPGGTVPWAEASIDQIPESGYGLYLMSAVFPEIRPSSREGTHGIEMELSF